LFNDVFLAYDDAVLCYDAFYVDAQTVHLQPDS